MSKPACLLLSPRFFGYEEDIADALRARGLEVVFADERPSNGSLMRVLVRLRPEVVALRTQRYYRGLLRRVAHMRFSSVVVIKGEVVPEWFLDELRDRNPAARFIFYTYDSVLNSPQFLRIAGSFDRLLTFDRDDAKAIPSLTYLPLFYAPEFELQDETLQPLWDFVFVGTLHSDRFRFAMEISTFYDKPFLFFYCPARWYFFVTKYITRENRTVPWRSVSFKPLERSQVAEIFKRSSAVLDVQRDGQVGLTMRTFEVLASGARLLTTNQAVELEPIFDPQFIRVLSGSPDRTVLERDRGVQRGMRPGPPPGLETYSIGSWASKLLA